MSPRCLFFGAFGALTLAGLLSASSAYANGRYPVAGQITIDPTNPAKIVVRATYGILITQDAGAHWSWVCERGVGYDGAEDPMMGMTQDGSILAGLFEGLSTSRDGGCQWGIAQGALAGRYVIDLAVERLNPKSALLLTSNSMGAGMFSTQVWESSDNGMKFSQAGVDLPTSLFGLTVDSAPSDPLTLYVSGRLNQAANYAGVLERSIDRGKKWEQFPIPGSNDLALPYIGGVDPKNANVVYVRLDAAKNDRLLVTKTGGAMWNEIYTGQDSDAGLLGFAVSPDGTSVAVGGPDDGLLIAPAGTLQFKKVSSIRVRCLTWTADGLYVCADEPKDGFSVGISQDNGLSFKPLMHIADLCSGPLACAPQTSTGKECPMSFELTRVGLRLECGAQTGGATSSSSSGASSTSSGASTSGPSEDGCSCKLAASPVVPTRLWWAWIGLAAVARLFTRRGRGSPWKTP